MIVTHRQAYALIAGHEDEPQPETKPNPAESLVRRFLAILNFAANYL